MAGAGAGAGVGAGPVGLAPYGAWPRTGNWSLKLERGREREREREGRERGEQRVAEPFDEAQYTIRRVQVQDPHGLGRFPHLVDVQWLFQFVFQENPEAADRLDLILGNFSEFALFGGQGTVHERPVGERVVVEAEVTEEGDVQAVRQVLELGIRSVLEEVGVGLDDGQEEGVGGGLEEAGRRRRSGDGGGRVVDLVPVLDLVVVEMVREVREVLQELVDDIDEVRERPAELGVVAALGYLGWCGSGRGWGGGLGWGGRGGKGK